MTFDLSSALAKLPTSGRALVLTHNNPDPDAIASAFGMKKLLESETEMTVEVGYGGFIGRAENLALVELLDLKMIRGERIDLAAYDCICLVDSQPGGGNSRIGADDRIDMVVDHHQPHADPQIASWFDLRPEVGATTSIVLSYLTERGIIPDRVLATAMLYGIISDTMDLGRGGGDIEFQAYLKLMPLADLPLLGLIRRPDLPPIYFRLLADGLEQTEIFDGVFGMVYIKDMPYPDLPAEIAELLVRSADIEVFLCAGCFEGNLFLSLRTTGEKYNAGGMIQQLIGAEGSAGGHGNMAGGFIRCAPEKKPEEVAVQKKLRMLEMLGLDAGSSKRLLDLAP